MPNTPQRSSMAHRCHIGYVTAALLTVFCFLGLVYAEVRLLSLNQSLEERIINYESSRALYLLREQYHQLGGQVPLNELELQANARIRSIKRLEYEQGEQNPDEFKPAQHFFKVHEQITRTPLFQWLQSMPKGGVLHAHDTALCSTDYLMQLTYREQLWVCQGTTNDTYVALRFSREVPHSEVGRCTWILLTELRELLGAEQVDQKLRASLTLYPREQYDSAYGVWKEFRGLFRLVHGLLTYEPIWGEYYYHALEEFYADGVQYMELRSTLPILYDLDGRNYTIIDTTRALHDASQRFARKHPDFIGSKVIYAPSRQVSDALFDGYLDNALTLKGNFPNFFAGFDLVSHEDAGRPLKDFAHKLLAVQPKINFYFHAGETNWYGSASDQNLIDAVLLGTKRIGHGFALPKHPEVLQALQRQNIAVEVSPISNQVLQHVKDFRNHPAAYFFANNYPVVISTDDPSFWKSAPLTHDFYVAFLGIASKSADLGMLKQLALNSLKYSALDEASKLEAIGMWRKRWDAWIQQLNSA